MKRVILDTNIYGIIAEKENIEEFHNVLENKKSVIIYGFDIVRKELRRVPKNIIIKGHNFRVLLLNLYDRVTRNHALHKTKLIEQLATDYYSTYVKLFGHTPKDKILDDFLIVACASINGLDVVVSEDSKTMLSSYAKKTYNIVNSLRGHATPDFLNYSEFRRLFS